MRPWATPPLTSPDSLRSPRSVCRNALPYVARSSDISADGTHVAFTADPSLFGDPSGYEQVYLSDLASPPVLTVTNLSTASISVKSFECGLADTTDALEQTAAGGSGLQNLGGGNYQLNWKSNTGWAGSCKVMHLEFGDGIRHDAYFKFTK